MFQYQETKNSAPLSDWKHEMRHKESSRAENFDPSHYKKPMWLQPSNAEKQRHSGGSGIIPSGGQEAVTRGRGTKHTQKVSCVNPVTEGTRLKARSTNGKNVYQEPDYDPIRMQYRAPVQHIDTPQAEVPFAAIVRKERLHSDPTCLYFPGHAKSSLGRMPSQVEAVNNHLSHQVAERERGLGAVNPQRLDSHMKGGVGPSNVPYFPKNNEQFDKYRRDEAHNTSARGQLRDIDDGQTNWLSSPRSKAPLGSPVFFWFLIW